jgi:exopolysaccharide biosynthesis protein
MAGILFAIGAIALLSWGAPLHAETITTTNPYEGITLISDVDPSSVSRPVSINVAEINLTAPGISFEMSPAVTPPSPYNQTYVTTLQTTLAFQQQVGAQMAVNTEFFLPYPGAGPTSSYTNLVGFAASNGNIYSPFQTPAQSYAIVTDAPAINITQNNQASIVTAAGNGTQVQQNVSIYNAFSGSAQIITNGVVTIPVYKDATHPNGLLTPDSYGTSYSNSNSWYNAVNARTIVGLTQNNQTLVIFTVDNAAGSQGMNLTEAANYLLTNYGVYNALNLDGGGSTTLTAENPTTGVDYAVNNTSNAGGLRAEGANLAIFAEPVPIPPAFLLMGSGLASLVFVRVRRRVLGA